MKFWCSHRGTISVFLSLILLPVIVFGGLVTDAVRVYHSKSLVSEAGELAMNAGLSYYDSQLKDEYGLLAMSKTPDKLDLEKYFIDTIRASGLEGAGDVSSFLDLKIDGNLSAYGVDGSQIYQTEAEKQQILEYMKYRAPVCIGEELIQKLNQIKESKKQVEAIEKQTKFAEKMEDLQEACEKAKEKIEEYLDFAEQSPVIAKENINRSISAAEINLQKAVDYLLMFSVCENFSQKDIAENFMDSMAAFNEVIGNAPEPSADNLEINFPIYVRGIFYLNNIPKTGLDALVAAAKTGKSDSEAEAIDAIYTRYNSLFGKLTVYSANLRETAYARIDTACNDIKVWKAKIEQAEKLADRCMDKLNNVERKLADAQTAHGEWKGKIAELSNGEMKTNMDNEANKYADLLDQHALEELKRKFSENKNALMQIKTKLEQTKFCGYSLTGGINKNSVKAQVNAKGQTLGISVTNPNMLLVITNGRNQFMSDNFAKKEITENLHQIRTDAFYKQLEKLCTEKNTNPQKEKEGKNTTNNLLEKLKSAIEGDGVSDLENISWDEKILPTIKLEQQKKDEPDGIDADTGKSDSRSGRKKTLQNAQKSLNSMGGLLDKISVILEGAIENIYIMEYGMQMFSYYTVNKDANGANKPQSDIKSLSGDDLTNNALYRSEVEYMLWGEQDVKKNVNNTRLLLYGIRMVFNMIYAFTDSEINSISSGMAEVMSCGIQFLVPVIKVVIQVGTAFAETACDVTDLMAGKNVPIIKDKDTRQIDLGAGGNQVTPSVSEKFTLNYKEYLTIFLLVRTISSSEKKTLARIADCIQLNTELDIIDAYTMLSVKANVLSRTTFMKKASELPDSSISAAKDWFTISYQSVLGY